MQRTTWLTMALLVAVIGCSVPASAETLWEKLRQRKHQLNVTGPNGQTVSGSADVDGTTQGVVNEDGSLTVTNQGIVTNGQGGTVDGSSVTDFRKTDDGVAFDRTGQWQAGDGEIGGTCATTGLFKKTEGGGIWNRGTTHTGKQGTTTQTDVDGQWKRNDDGSYTFYKNKKVTLPNGKVVTQQEATTLRKTAEGLQWTTDGTTTGPDGKQWKKQTVGSGQKTDKGFTWKADTDGGSADGTFKWNRGATGERIRTDDGTVTNMNTTGSSNFGENLRKGIEDWKAKHRSTPKWQPKWKKR